MGLNSWRSSLPMIKHIMPEVGNFFIRKIFFWKFKFHVVHLFLFGWAFCFFFFLPKKRAKWFKWMDRISVRRVLFQNGFYISWLKPLLTHFHDSDRFMSSTLATRIGELESYVIGVVVEEGTACIIPQSPNFH